MSRQRLDSGGLLKAGRIGSVSRAIDAGKEWTMNVRERIVDFICDEILFNDKARALDLNDPLIGSEGIVDSFGLNQLIVFVEGDLGIQVDDLDVAPENFETLEALVSFVERKREGNSA
jgi:acyl carrier protein